ncbi:hypothetical protein G6F51_014459 [Rhizopus arrhizus]|uniref:Uncharacterized protein n=1 Tax=Rhizopus oryzae TaxID=64495 RepID=A0A9P6XLY8_RHIOR|nr:hypothetical protein G6F51_014459 [Rhizopus arrhizus]
MADGIRQRVNDQCVGARRLDLVQLRAHVRILRTEFLVGHRRDAVQLQHGRRVLGALLPIARRVGDDGDLLVLRGARRIRRQ